MSKRTDKKLRAYWVAVEGSILTVDKFKRTTDFGAVVNCQEAIAYNLAPEIAAHIVLVHNDLVRMREQCAAYKASHDAEN